MPRLQRPPLGATTHLGSELWSDGRHSVLRCDACGFAHLDPLPTADELRAFYATEFYGSVVPQYLDEPDADTLAWSATAFDDRLALIARFTDGRALLDLGAGRGSFVEHARERGWDAAALEPSSQAAAALRARGIRCHEGLVEDLEPEPIFDAVTAVMLLEHVLDPAAVLARARGWLRDGGVALIAVPNEFNLLQRELMAQGAQAWFVAPKLHLNYFDFASLEALLMRGGLEPVARTTTFPMALFALLGDDFVASPELGPACHGRRKHLDTSMTPEGRRELYTRLASVDLGRHAIVAARKV